MKVYAEAGIGNGTCLSTEYEKSDGSEYRVKGFFVQRLKSVYIRIWIKNQVLILDSKDRLKRSSKDRKRFKLIFGIQSV